MNSNALIDALKRRFNVSEYALARDILKVEPNSLRDMRRRGLSEERVLQIAALLEIDPGEPLAAIRAERAKHPNVKAAWRKVAESVRTALGVFVPGLIAAAAVAISSGPSVCILCKIVRRWLRRFGAIIPDMRSWTILAVVALLAACGNEYSAFWTYPTAPGRCEYTGPATGICVAWDADAPYLLPDRNRATEGPSFESVYQLVGVCMNIFYGIAPPPGPVVRVVGAPIQLPDRTAVAITDPATGQITLFDFFSLDHESIHYILLRATGDADAAHRHPAFTSCAN